MTRWLQQQYKYAIEGFFNVNYSRFLSLNVFFGQKIAEVYFINSIQYFLFIFANKFADERCFSQTQYYYIFHFQRLHRLRADSRRCSQQTHQKSNQRINWYLLRRKLRKMKKKMYTMSEKRIMLTHWIGQTWRKFHHDNPDLIRKTFRKLRLFFAINESENDEIWIKNILDVKVRNWKRSDQKKC